LKMKFKNRLFNLSDEKQCRIESNQRNFDNQLFREDSSWTGYSTSDVKEWLSKGFNPPALDLGNPPVPIREKRRLRFAEEGDEFHIDLAYSGVDEYFSEWTKREAIPGLAVQAEMWMSSSTPSETTEAYFSFICRALYALEMAGVDTEVTLTYTSDDVHPGAHTSRIEIVVKKENEASDFNSWSAMISPASLRAFGFASMCLHSDERNQPVFSYMGSARYEQNRFFVQWNPESRKLEIGCPSTPRMSPGGFPEDYMQAQLKKALAEIHKGTD